MSDSLSVCETCGAKFAPTGEVTSSRVLCPTCAAERRAQLRAAKATPPRPATASAPAPAAAAAKPAQPDGGVRVARETAREPKRAATSQVAERPSRSGRVARDAGAPGDAQEHHLDVRKMKEQAQKKMMTIAWAVCGGLALITGAVWLFAKGENNARAETQAEREKYLDQLKAEVAAVNLNDEGDLNRVKERIQATRKDWRHSRIEGDMSAGLTKINASIAQINQTRGLVAQLDSIDAQLKTQPGADTLAKLFVTARDGELANLAKEAGGTYKTRYDGLVTTVNRDYIGALRTAASAAASATTLEGLAPFGQLEDALRAVIEDATTANDVETQNVYRPMHKQVANESNQIATKLFDEAYQSKVQWKDLLGDVPGWQVIASSSFTHKFGGGLTLTNAASPDAASGGLSYLPGKGWRDYVIDMELKLDSGSLVVYTRVGDKMDSKFVPAQTIGLAKNPNILLEAGKTHNLTISVIGDRLGVMLDGTMLPGDESIGLSKSRKGEPGIVAQAGTTATITRLRVRHLR